MDRASLSQLKSMQNPPQVVQMVFEPICLLLGHQKTDWTTAHSLLSDPNKFVTMLSVCDLESIPIEIFRKIVRIVRRPEFDV